MTFKVVAAQCPTIVVGLGTHLLVETHPKRFALQVPPRDRSGLAELDPKSTRDLGSRLGGHGRTTFQALGHSQNANDVENISVCACGEVSRLCAYFMYVQRE